jgi:hypothetical protein
MTQPNCYFTLKTPLATIIGLYSNVPGQLDRVDRTQEDWLTSELKAAKDNRCVIVAVHHPPYSIDSVHGGHAPIREALDRTFEASGRIPDLVLTAHVHDYQHFERDMGGGKSLHYVVAGAGGFAGYTSLHKLKNVADVDLPSDVSFVKGNDKLPGFMKIGVTPTQIECEYYTVSRADSAPDTVASVFETFAIPLAPRNDGGRMSGNVRGTPPPSRPNPPGTSGPPSGRRKSGPSR